MNYYWPNDSKNSKKENEKNFFIDEISYINLFYFEIKFPLIEMDQS
jgi:hypothetical protein